MPELPEVQSVVNHFKPLLVDQKIQKIISPNGYEKVFDTHSISKINTLTKTLLIKDVIRRGKYIVLYYFSSALLYICLFLKHFLHRLQQQYLQLRKHWLHLFAFFFERNSAVVCV